MIHSRKSWGRVPTIVATIMLHAYDELTPDQAIDQVRKLISRHSVQTVKQYNPIHEFDAYRRKIKCIKGSVDESHMLRASVAKAAPVQSSAAGNISILTTSASTIVAAPLDACEDGSKVRKSSP